MCFVVLYILHLKLESVVRFGSSKSPVLKMSSVKVYYTQHKHCMLVLGPCGPMVKSPTYVSA